MEDLWDDTEQGKMEVMSDKHITVPHFYHRFHTDWTGTEPGLS